MPRLSYLYEPRDPLPGYVKLRNAPRSFRLQAPACSSCRRTRQLRERIVIRANALSSSYVCGVFGVAVEAFGGCERVKAACATRSWMSSSPVPPPCCVVRCAGGTACGPRISHVSPVTPRLTPAHVRLRHASLQHPARPAPSGICCAKLRRVTTAIVLLAVPCIPPLPPCCPPCRLPYPRW